MPEPLIREFRLAKGRPDGLNPFLDENGAFLGTGTPLLERDAVGRWRPRPRRDLESILAKAYGVPVDLEWRMESLATVAKSTLVRLLNQGDYDGAAREFPNWARVGTSHPQRQKDRRAAEQEMFMNGAHP